MRFLCDNNLGKLVRHLRIAGFDTAENKNHNYNEIINQAIIENRIIITRDNKLIKKIYKDKINVEFLKINSTLVTEQFKEVLNAYRIKPDIELIFTRCPLCNEVVVPVSKKDLKDKIPQHTFKVQSEFWQCPNCKKYYWPGSHWNRIVSKFRKILKEIYL